MTKGWKTTGVAAAAIIVLTVALYIPVLHGGFLWDDDTLITNNQMIRAPDGLYRFWFTSEAPDYYPLTWSLWWLEWRWWGANPIGYHVVNVLLHAANAVLVWIILKRLRIPGAWLAAMVFAIHPVNVATVAWIVEQKNTLSMLFYALAILCYLRFDEEAAAQQRGSTVVRWAWYALSLTTFLLALLSKSATVMLPVVLLGCVWWRHGRVRMKDWLYSVPFFVLSLVFGLVTIWFQYHHAIQGHTIRPESFAGRLATAGWMPWFYLSKVLLPISLTVIYPKWHVTATELVAYIPGLVLVGALIVFWWKRKSWGHPILFGLGYFVVTLFPVMGFFDQGFFQFSLVADHWQYYSIIGMIALVVAAGESLCDWMGERGNNIQAIVSVTLLVLLGGATWKRSAVYADAEKLWRENVARCPGAWGAHNNLGMALAATDRNQEAIDQFQLAVRYKPDYAMAHYNLANTLLHLGHPTEAIAHYRLAVQFQPNLLPARFNLAAVLLDAGNVPEAIQHFQQVVTLMPNLAEAHYKLAVAWTRLGNYEAATNACENAVRLGAGFPQALADCSWLLSTHDVAASQNVKNAVALAERAATLTGTTEPAYLDALAAAYAANGQFNNAVVTAERAIALAGAAGATQLRNQINQRLSLYRSGHPYRTGLTTPLPSDW